MERRERILPRLLTACGALLLGPCILYAQPGPGGPTTNEIIAAANARESIAKAERAEAEARTAASQAEVAAATARFGPLGNSSNTGNVTAGNGAGSMEVELMADAALQAAALELGMRLCRLVASQPAAGSPPADCLPKEQNPVVVRELPQLSYDRLGYPASCTDRLNYEESFQDTRTPNRWRPLIFVTQTDFAHFEIFESFMIRLTAVGRNMCQAIDLARTATAQTASSRNLPLKPRQRDAPAVTTEGVVGGTAGFGIEAASVALNTLAGLFRTEYNVQSVAATKEERLFARETMLAVLRRSPNTPVFAPTLFPTSANAANNPLIRRLNVLDEIRRDSLDESNRQAELAQIFGALRETVLDAHVPTVTTAASLHTERRTAIQAAITAYAALIEAASTPPATGGGSAVLPVALRQARSAQLMRQDGILVVTETNRVGGSTLTRRNFFTAFGRMPFYVSAGALVSFSVMDGRSGQVLESGTIPVAGGYQQIEDVHARFPLPSDPDRRVRRR